MFAHVGFSGLSWALSQSLAGKSDQFLQFSLWLKCVLLPVFSSVSINPTSRWRPCNQSHPKISPAWEFSPYYTLLKDLHFCIKIRDLLEGPIGGEPLRCDGLGAGVCARPAEHHLRAVRLGFWQRGDFWGAAGAPVEDQPGHHRHLARSALEHWRQRWGEPSWNQPSLWHNSTKIILPSHMHIYALWILCEIPGKDFDRSGTGKMGSRDQNSAGITPMASSWARSPLS